MTEHGTRLPDVGGDRDEPLEGDTLGQLARIIGRDAAVRISAAVGGRELYIPKDPPPTSELVKVVGSQAATLLARRFGGVTFVIPVSAGKRQRIIELSQRGKPVHAIARQVGCTERHVYNVRREYREKGGWKISEPAPDPMQQDLFTDTHNSSDEER